MKTHNFAKMNPVKCMFPRRITRVVTLLFIAAAGLRFSPLNSPAMAQSSGLAGHAPAAAASNPEAKENPTPKPSTDASPNDPAIRDYLSGNGLLNRGLFDLAAAEYRKFLAAHPDHEKAPLAHYGLGVCLFRQSQFDPALAELASLVAQNDFPFAAEVGTMRGQCLLSLKRFDEGASAFEQAVSKFPNHALADDAAAGAIEALFQSNKTDAVMERSKAFADRFGESPLHERVEYLWALAAIAKSDSVSAIEHLTFLLEHYPKSAYCDHATLLLAQCEQTAGNSEHAIANYRRVLTKPDSAYTAESLLALGTLLHSQKQLAAAGEALDRLLEKSGNSPLVQQAQLERGLVFFDDEKFDRAASLLDSLASTDAENADEAAYWAAKCRIRQNQFAEAARLLSDADSRFGKSRLLPEMTYDRAVALIRANSADDAVAALNELRTRFPQHALFPEAAQLLAVTLHQQKKYDESEKLCAEFLRQFDKHALTPTVLFLSGENEFLGGKYAEAVERFRDFLTRYTSDARAVTAGYRIAMALYRLERFDEAEPLLTKLAPLAAKDATYRNVLLALGDVYVRRGDWKNAELALTDYLNVGLDVTGADNALMKLAMTKERQDRGLDALADYTRLIERFPKSTYRVSAMFEKGQILLSKDRLDEAAAAFEKVIDDGADAPFIAHAKQHLAAIAMRQQKFDRAAELYAQAATAKASAGDPAGTHGAIVTGNNSAESESFLG
ncbi:MAG: tetratricopeptide repeat protein, partial [Planctomycetes bacterium]|nr:tetratricopeptide repeat protein [Planctomycetota bacterium]